MKKTASILFVIAIMACMIVTMSGCSEQQKIVGTWETTIDMTDFLNKSINREHYVLDEECKE